MNNQEKQLKRIADLLEYSLGDTDSNLPDDQDVLEDEFPVHAAMQLVVELMLAARATPADHISQARDAVIEQCAKVCDEYGHLMASEKDSALLVGKIALSNAMSGEPRAAAFLAAAIRALKPAGDVSDI